MSSNYGFELNMPSGNVPGPPAAPRFGVVPGTKYRYPSFANGIVPQPTHTNRPSTQSKYIHISDLSDNPIDSDHSHYPGTTPGSAPSSAPAVPSDGQSRPTPQEAQESHPFLKNNSKNKTSAYITLGNPEESPNRLSPQPTAQTPHRNLSDVVSTNESSERHPFGIRQEPSIGYSTPDSTGPVPYSPLQFGAGGPSSTHFATASRRDGSIANSTLIEERQFDKLSVNESPSHSGPQSLGFPFSVKVSDPISSTQAPPHPNLTNAPGPFPIPVQTPRSNAMEEFHHVDSPIPERLEPPPSRKYTPLQDPSVQCLLHRLSCVLMDVCTAHSMGPGGSSSASRASIAHIPSCAATSRCLVNPWCINGTGYDCAFVIGLLEYLISARNNGTLENQLCQDARSSNDSAISLRTHIVHLINHSNDENEICRRFDGSRDRNQERNIRQSVHSLLRDLLSEPSNSAHWSATQVSSLQQFSQICSEYQSCSEILRIYNLDWTPSLIAPSSAPNESGNSASSFNNIHQHPVDSVYQAPPPNSEASIPETSRNHPPDLLLTGRPGHVQPTSNPSSNVYVPSSTTAPTYVGSNNQFEDRQAPPPSIASYDRQTFANLNNEAEKKGFPPDLSVPPQWRAPPMHAPRNESSGMSIEGGPLFNPEIEYSMPKYNPMITYAKVDYGKPLQTRAQSRSDGTVMYGYGSDIPLSSRPQYIPPISYDPQIPRTEIGNASQYLPRHEVANDSIHYSNNPSSSMSVPERSEVIGSTASYEAQYGTAKSFGIEMKISEPSEAEKRLAMKSIQENLGFRNANTPALNLYSTIPFSGSPNGVGPPQSNHPSVPVRNDAPFPSAAKLQPSFLQNERAVDSNSVSPNAIHSTWNSDFRRKQPSPPQSQSPPRNRNIRGGNYEDEKDADRSRAVTSPPRSQGSQQDSIRGRSRSQARSRSQLRGAREPSPSKVVLPHSNRKRQSSTEYPEPDIRFLYIFVDWYNVSKFASDNLADGTNEPASRSTLSMQMKSRMYSFLLFVSIYSKKVFPNAQIITKRIVVHKESCSEVIRIDPRWQVHFTGRATGGVGHYPSTLQDKMLESVSDIKAEDASSSAVLLFSGNGSTESPNNFVNIIRDCAGRGILCHILSWEQSLSRLYIEMSEHERTRDYVVVVPLDRHASELTPSSS